MRDRSTPSRFTRLLLTALLLLGLFGPPLAARAASTCGSAASEAGGAHKRCSSSKGVFHVWTPSGFDASKPGYTVVYAHGYSDQCAAPSSQDTDDGVPDDWFNTPGAVYIDAAWTAHGLAGQFSSGNLPNALYVAPQEATCGAGIHAKDPAHVDNNTHWDNFADLLSDLTSAGVTRPNGPIVLMGHSGAYREIDNWIKSSSDVKHIIFLDTMYSTVANSDFKSWMQASGHTASIVQADPDTKTKTAALVQSLGLTSVTDVPSSLSSLSDASQKAPVLSIVSTNETHMQLILAHLAIPVLLQRVPLAGTASSPTAPAPAPSASAGQPAGVPPTSSSAPVTFQTPRLEIPIPNVNFTQGLSADSAITLPWIAQYVSGVYTFLISIVGVVAAVMMIIGGFQYLTSAGDKSKITAGKKRIVDALIGLTLTFGSYLMLYTINPNLVSFASLQLLGVKTEQYSGMYTPAVPSEIVVPPGSSASTGGSMQWCNWVSGLEKNKNSVDCVPVCQSWGCGTEISDSNCDFSKMPIEGPGMINPNSPDLVSPSDTANWPAMKNVKVRSQSIKATRPVVLGLQRLDAFLDLPTSPYSGKGYSVQVNTCWRDWRGDAAKECGIVLGDHNQPGKPVSHDPNDFYLAWPGSNPHSSGTACDMVLKQNNTQISAIDGGQQNCLSRRAPDQTFVDIMTGPEVGARRLDFEAWHFEWGSSYGCRCTGQACDAIFPIGTSCHAIDQKYAKNC